MKEITFDNLIKIFGAAQATSAVVRYVDKEYIELQKIRSHFEDAETRIVAFQNNPNTFVMALKINDSVWNKKAPSKPTIIGYTADESPIFAETGPIKDRTGQYIVKCPNGEFTLQNGDYLYLTADNWNNQSNLMVMSKTQFESCYIRSENTSHFQ